MSDLGAASNRPLRLLVVLGTRPEAIKLAPVILELRKTKDVQPVVLATGQHRELVSQVLTPFGVEPDIDLDLMEKGQSLTQILHRAMSGLDSVYDELQPDMVVVQGDTTSAFGGALAAFHRQIPVAHVEAGLRSFDRRHPFPEEVNRRMISAVTDLHLAPTSRSADNLRREGVPESSIVITGNTAVDALLFALENPPSADEDWARELRIPEDGPMMLVTLHRREAWLEREPSDDGPGRTLLEVMAEGLRGAAQDHPDGVFVFPVHPNPRVREPVHRILGDTPNVRLVEPVPYFPFAQLMARAEVILTDSGGIQEEAPSIGKPVLVLRQTTERPEGLTAARNRLVGTDSVALRNALTEEIESRPTGPARWPRPNPYGDGRAASRVCRAALHFFGRGPRPEDFNP